MRNVCLLGASGNIGTQSLDIFAKDKDNFNLVSISVGHKVNKIPAILSSFPSIEQVTVLEKTDYDRLKEQFPNVTFYYGDKGILEMLEETKADMVENALVGFSGLFPSVKALELSKILCLANKESLVVGGDFIKKLLKEGKGKLYPIDSEHVAIAKCFEIARRKNVNVKQILITASGGAFRNLKRDELRNVSKSDALNHPTWAMGSKITIDSDTMFNKGFEVIEAAVLFDWDIDDVTILLHDESHLHSALKLSNGKILGEINKPDMHGPIAYALYEGNVSYDDVYEVRDVSEFGPFHFHEFDKERYPAVSLALEAYKKGTSCRTILNAAVEECDYLFLEEKIAFADIERYVMDALDNVTKISNPTLENIKEIDSKTREYLRKKLGD